MLRWTFLLLLALNLGLLAWGWSHDRPLDTPPLPLPQAPGQIRLPSELPPPADPVAIDIPILPEAPPAPTDPNSGSLAPSGQELQEERGGDRSRGSP